MVMAEHGTGRGAEESWSRAYAGIRVVVLGASGFVGQWVSGVLARCGAELHLVVRDRRGADPVLSRHQVVGRVVEADLRDAQRVGEMLRGVGPAVVFNLAGYGVDRSERDEQAAFQINEGLLSAVCRGLSGGEKPGWRGQRVVHVGSALEYGEIGGDLSEESEPNPTTLYGRSKLAGTRALERGCRERGLRGLTARLFTVYGPGEHAGRLLPSLLETARTHRPLPLTAGEQKRDFTYVEDVAEGLLRLGLSDAAPGQVVNLATGRLTTVRGFVETAAKVLDIPRELLRFGEVPTRAEEMRHDDVAVGRLKGLIRWTPPTDIPEGVRRARDFEG